MTQEEVLNNIKENIYDRATLFQKYDEDKELKKHIFVACEKDPIYFFKYFLYTDRNASLIPESF